MSLQVPIRHICSIKVIFTSNSKELSYTPAFVGIQHKSHKCSELKELDSQGILLQDFSHPSVNLSHGSEWNQ